MKSAPGELILGLDIGGSKTHAVLTDLDGELIAQRMAGSANIASVGLVRARAVLAELVAELAGAMARRGIATCCAGAAGANAPQQREELRVLLGTVLPGVPVHTVHDAQLLLAAAELEAGATLICGTGSVGWARRPDGAEQRAGGWGYLLGDEGSGYGMARDIVRAALDAHDHGRPVDALTAAMLERAGAADVDALLTAFYSRPERNVWAERADILFPLARSGDPAAHRIIDEAADALTGLVRTVFEVVDWRGPVVCAGGVITHQPLLFDRVRERLVADGIADVRVLDREPVWGAVQLARQLFGRRGNDTISAGTNPADPVHADTTDTDTTDSDTTDATGRNP